MAIANGDMIKNTDKKREAEASQLGSKVGRLIRPSFY
jgi:hypothetical protein